MICQSCQNAAFWNSKNNQETMAHQFHSECKGDCGCQHRIGRGWFVKPGEKVPAMRTQSP